MTSQTDLNRSIGYLQALLETDSSPEARKAILEMAISLIEPYSRHE